MAKRRSNAVDTRPAKKARASTAPRASARSLHKKTNRRQIAKSPPATPSVSGRRSSIASTPSPPSRSKRNVSTRSMTLRKRTQFPFLKLPAELRNLIYEKSLDFEGVGRLLTEHYEAHVNDGTSIDWPELQTHPLLVVNKQISREARYILHRKTLRLPHSTTPNGLITDVVSKSILENVRKVDITRDESFGEMHTWCDFLEFFRLIKSAVNIWTDCHHLQELTIVMQGKQVMTHLDSCPAQGHCFFLDEIEKMMSSLEELRGIKKVTFGGFLEDYAAEAKRWMETPPAYILKKIPLQVRKQIYGYLIDLNDANASLVKASDTAVAGWNPPKTMDAIAPSMGSPDLLRVNKQITAEILEGMYSENFTISAPPPHHVHTCTSVTKFIGLHNLQEIRHLTLDISSRGSSYVAADWRILIKELAVKLKTKRNLVSLHINVHDAGWIETQLKADKRATSRTRPDSKDHDFYGLKVLGELTTKRLSQTWLRRLTFGEGVHDDVKSHLQTQLCGSKMKRWSEAEETYGLQGLVAED